MDTVLTMHDDPTQLKNHHQNFRTNHVHNPYHEWSLHSLGRRLIEISIHKPCTKNCGGLRIEPVPIEKHIEKGCVTNVEIQSSVFQQRSYNF